MCWPGLFSSRVWLDGPLCLCDVVKELQAYLRTLGRPRLGQAACLSVATAVVWLISNFFSGNRSWEWSVASGRLWKDIG